MINSSQKKNMLIKNFYIFLFYFMPIIYAIAGKINGFAIVSYYSSTLPYYVLLIPISIGFILFWILDLKNVFRGQRTATTLFYSTFQFLVTIAGMIFMMLLPTIFISFSLRIIDIIVYSLLAIQIIYILFTVLILSQGKYINISEKEVKEKKFVIGLLQALSILSILVILYWIINFVYVSQLYRATAKAKIMFNYDISMFLTENKTGTMFILVFYMQFVIKLFYVAFTRKRYYWLIPLVDFIALFFILIKRVPVIKYKLWSLSIITLIALPLPFYVIYSATGKGIDAPTKSFKNVTFSVNPATHNRIVVFSDGLDGEQVLKVNNYENELSDFTIFKNVATHGFYTDGGISSGFYGPDALTDPAERYIYTTKEMINYQGMHGTSDEYQKNILGPSIFTSYKIKNEDGWNPFKNFSGYGFAVENELFYNDDSYLQSGKMDKSRSNTNEEIHILNWRGAKQIISGDNFDNTAPFTAPYEAFLSTAIEGSPSYSYISEDMTHMPTTLDQNGNQSLYLNFNRKSESFEYLVNYFGRLKDKLSNIKDPTSGITAWDNTEIIIWGDHSNHENLPVNINEFGETRKSMSALMVKPAVESHNQNNGSAKVFREPFDAFNIKYIKDMMAANTYDTYDEFRVSIDPAKSSDRGIFIKKDDPILVMTQYYNDKKKIAYWLSRFDENKQMQVPYYTSNQNGWINSWKISEGRYGVNDQSIKSELIRGIKNYPINP